MKEVGLLLLVAISTASATISCCKEGEDVTIRGYCANNTERINLNCTVGHMLLKHVVINGDKVSTKDTPGFIFVRDPNEYCVGQMYKNSSDHSEGMIPVAVACYGRSDIGNKSGASVDTGGVLTLISVVFLLATFAIYAFLPQLRDLQGLCYMCMCISMAIGFLTLGLLQLAPNFEGTVCATTGFLLYFWMLATFFWMNVICVNMYRTITADAAFMKRTQRKQFFLYSGYAWGSTIVFFIVALITNFSEGNHYKPGISASSCWINGSTETWIFFYGPVAFLLVVNICIFAISCFRLWRDTRQLEATKLNYLKHRFLLSLKLFLVMGITWVFEVVSFAHGGAHILWEIMDTINCLQGIIIFVLLVVIRRRAVQGLADAGLCLFVTRPLAEKLSPHDNSFDQQIMEEEVADVHLN